MPLQKPPFSSWVVLKQLCIDTAGFLHVATLSLMPFNLGAAVFCTAVQTCYRDYSINFLVYLFIYLFIYKLRQEAWITHRSTSITSSRGKKKKKICNTTNKNDNTKKRGMPMQKQNLGGHRLKNQQHIQSSKLFNGWLVWHLIHTLLKISMYITEKVMRVTEKII